MSRNNTNPKRQRGGEDAVLGALVARDSTSSPPRWRFGLVWRCVVVSLVAVFANIAAAHPFHTSTAEAEWNADSKRLEVALRVSGEDLEAALNLGAKGLVKLDDSETADEAIQRYLKKSFIIRKTQDDEPLELHWVGKEATPKAVWLYFEVDAPDGVAGYELTNRVLHDVEETQINTLVIKLGERKVSLRCDRKRPKVLIELTEASAASDELSTETGGSEPLHN